eukprot:GILJ01001104.1.p1 GENE.GILJ01001104.1~~GILJ01001104.1.p1  ORF type:complete len:343 (-),score=62.12 GILJ01001104.1:250-1278(-)
MMKLLLVVVVLLSVIVPSLAVQYSLQCSDGATCLNADEAYSSFMAPTFNMSLTARFNTHATVTLKCLLRFRLRSAPSAEDVEVDVCQQTTINFGDTPEWKTTIAPNDYHNFITSSVGTSPLFSDIEVKSTAVVVTAANGDVYASFGLQVMETPLVDIKDESIGSDSASGKGQYVFHLSQFTSRRLALLQLPSSQDPTQVKFQWHGESNRISVNVINGTAHRLGDLSSPIGWQKRTSIWTYSGPATSLLIDAQLDTGVSTADLEVLVEVGPHVADGGSGGVNKIELMAYCICGGGVILLVLAVIIMQHKRKRRINSSTVTQALLSDVLVDEKGAKKSLVRGLN